MLPNIPILKRLFTGAGDAYLTLKASKEVAETVNALAKRNGISRDEYLTRAIISLLHQEDLK